MLKQLTDCKLLHRLLWMNLKIVLRCSRSQEHLIVDCTQCQGTMHFLGQVHRKEVFCSRGWSWLPALVTSVGFVLGLL